MQALAERAAERLRDADKVTVYAHIDADGLTAGSIASLALDRAGIDHDVRFLKKVDAAALEAIRDENPPLAWFCDFGAGALDRLAGIDAVIADHHEPVFPTPAGTGLLLDYGRVPEGIVMVNPHLLGLDGSTDVSGAGCAYLVARALDAKNADLASLAVVGAVGDLEDVEHRRLVGTNRRIVEDGVAADVVARGLDVRFFGRETRPIYKLLEYSNDPLIPRLTGNEEACMAFVAEAGIELREGEDGPWRRWIDLQMWERRRLLSDLVMYLLQRGCTAAMAQRLIGEVYTLPRERGGTPLHDAKEFATLLNACGRYDAAEVALAVCKGDRGAMLERALELLREHRGTIVESLDVIHEMGVGSLEAVQYFHGGDRIRDTVVGIAAGMVLGSGEVDRGKPIIGFADAEDGVKVSARTTRELAKSGVDLAAILREAALRVGGEGGGHNVAAGATIPRGKETEFLEIVNELVATQRSRNGLSNAST